MRPSTLIFLLSVGFVFGPPGLCAKAAPAVPDVRLNEAGGVLEKRLAGRLDALRAEISRSLPEVDPEAGKALDLAGDSVRKATATAEAARAELGGVGAAKGLVDHAKGKWIGGAEKNIATAMEALKKATSPAERAAAEKELAHWQKNKAEGEAALRERQAKYEALKAKEADLHQASKRADAALAKAREEEDRAAGVILKQLSPMLDAGTADPVLAECLVLTAATPARLAAFAQEDPEKAALIEASLGDVPLLVDMLVAGGAKFDEYARAFEILAAIRKASARLGGDPVLQRLALATCLEHARPIAMNVPAAPAGKGGAVDPVKRYLHYEKAYLGGELDPAFKTLDAWEMRMAVNCDSPDDILGWGREMLRNYRPDHIHHADYGWRYVSAVRTEVPYGSQNVPLDDPALQQHQNILMNGGVCGRRAFFGRFILRCFGIPTWGVTQRAHAAVSHWTPEGWVVNLGAGYQASWWDKDEVPMSGTQFLVETQARAHPAEFRRVLRARWISRILGEQAFNERRKVPGGFWSRVDRLCSMMLAAKAVTLGPLGQELAEANERRQKLNSAAVSEADRRPQAHPDGSISLPAVAHGKSSGSASAMKSIGEGMQLHVLGGFKAPYEIEVPKAGSYRLSVRVSTVQKGQILQLAANSAAAVPIPVPYTLGQWQATEPVLLDLRQGRNTIHLELKPGSRGVSLKELTLTPQG